MSQIKIPAYLIRGGTSKGLFFQAKHLPLDIRKRDAILLAAMGSPDPYKKQLDGLGGGISSTSKVVIVKPATNKEYDIECLFGQVSINAPLIDYSYICGNLTSALGLFAIEIGLIKPNKTAESITKIWVKHLQQKLIVRTPLHSENREPITIEFFASQINNKILPTSNPVDIIDIPNYGTIKATLINTGAPTIFISADELNLENNELSQIENIRCYCAVKMKLAKSVADAHKISAIPKIAMVSPAQDYQTDLSAKIFSMGRVHHAFTATGAIATSVAAQIPGTIVNQYIPKTPSDTIRIGHPSGIIEVTPQLLYKDNNWFFIKATYHRTARILMQGEILIPNHYIY